ncbi:MAG: hypothetical protein ABSD74_10310 [Rhizomicrobium sp.]|jgi:hypothetical protein
MSSDPDFYRVAFGSPLDLNRDVDASLKICLFTIAYDRRWSELLALLTTGSDLGGIAGDPGWILERRPSGSNTSQSEYANWPADAEFRSYIDPTELNSEFPEAFYRRTDLLKFVKAALLARGEEDERRIGDFKKLLETVTD